jgi:UDP-N-acetylglucosamine 2-epimerase (non-hydrolysing)
MPVKHILLVAGARPNFMKIAPLWRAFKNLGGRFIPILLHTGQHYDDSMSGAFFRDLGLPKPAIDLGVGSDSHAGQTAKVMVGFEREVERMKPHVVLVVGDVNSTLACALVCSKTGVPLGHVEAGLRSYDRSMPEEVNRVVTDVLATWLFTPSPDADRNLLAEGIPKSRIFRVGNIMIDSLVAARKRAASSRIGGRLGLRGKRFALLTLHRPSNVDGLETLKKIWRAIEVLSKEVSVVFPLHPRTRNNVKRFGLKNGPGVLLTEPLGYLDFLHLEERAAVVLTDSGGVQEETTYFGVPCLTLRENTERPITVEQGTNEVVGTNPVRILMMARKALKGEWKKGRRPWGWDGRVGVRVVEALKLISTSI